MSNEPQQAGPQAGARAPERLHPISWLFGIIGMLKQMIAPLFAVLVLGQRDSHGPCGHCPCCLCLPWARRCVRAPSATK